MLFKWTVLFIFFVTCQISLRVYYSYLMSLENTGQHLIEQQRRLVLIRDQLREPTEQAHSFDNLEKLLKTKSNRLKKNEI